MDEKMHARREARRNFRRGIRTAFAVIIILALTAVILYGYRYYNARVNGLEGEIGRLNDLFSSKTTVSTETIEKKIYEIGELSTCAFEYTNSKHIEDARALYGYDIPLTTNKVDLTYTGIIKVGYDVEKVGISVDNETMAIKVSLPEPRILDNYIVFDTLQCRESNNILNPLSMEKLVEYLREIEGEELETAVADGIYTKAEARMKLLVENFTAEFKDYTVTFA